MNYIYLVILHGLFTIWMFILGIIIYGTIFNISAGQTFAGHLTGFLIILVLLTIWISSYAYQVKRKTWKSLLIGNLVSFTPLFLLTEILPRIAKAIYGY